eukprot:3941577-Rhodomonas_salina.3
MCGTDPIAQYQIECGTGLRHHETHTVCSRVRAHTVCSTELACSSTHRTRCAVLSSRRVVPGLAQGAHGRLIRQKSELAFKRPAGTPLRVRVGS